MADGTRPLGVGNKSISGAYFRSPANSKNWLVRSSRHDAVCKVARRESVIKRLPRVAATACVAAWAGVEPGLLEFTLSDQQVRRARERAQARARGDG